MEKLFQGIFDAEYASVIALSDFMACVGISLLVGWILTLCYIHKNRYTKSFAATLALLPAAVCVVIMMVNGNVGAGVATAGAFGLVRFRSAPGSAREIGAIFLAMATGLMSGMGYLAYALLSALLFGGILVCVNAMDFGTTKNNAKYKTLHITIPEDLDYTDVFENILDTYTSTHVLTVVKTTNMGSLFRLTYDIVLRDVSKEKAMLDELRTRNGNLEISISRQETMTSEL